MIRRVGALVLLLAVAAWAATAGVRAWVDRRLDATHGRALDFELREPDGTLHRARDLRGRTVLLHCFRSRCASCVAERDAIATLGEELDPARAVLLGVLMDPVEGYPPAESAATLARFAFPHPVVLADAAFADALHGAGWSHVTPITYVLGPDGRIVTHLRGPQELAVLRAVLPPDALRR